jgi:hypothetical protein
MQENSFPLAGFHFHGSLWIAGFLYTRTETALEDGRRKTEDGRRKTEDGRRLPQPFEMVGLQKADFPL